MAQPSTNPKIEELRLRLKADPKSRLFYPLAEELRKIQQFTEAEQVLRGGLATHATYLSAWVSLGRVLREQGKNAEAVDPLSTALQIDPGNVVAARFLGDVYLALGEKVEAIKKYKLVHAMLPSDQELAEEIAQLDRELNPERSTAPPELEPAAAPEVTRAMELPPIPASFGADRHESENLRPTPTLETPFDQISGITDSQSPFDEQFAGAPDADFGSGSDSFGIGQFEEAEEPVHLADQSEAPFEHELSVQTPAPEPAPEPEPVELVDETADFFAPAAEASTANAGQQEPYVETGIASDLPFALESTLAPPEADDFTKTITMADLYAAQGLTDEARDIYEDILARDPANHSVRAKLEALGSDQVVPAEEPAPWDEEPAVENWSAQDESSTFAVDELEPLAGFPPGTTEVDVTEPSFPAGASHVEQSFSQAPDTAETASLVRIQRLRGWLSRVGRREVPGVL